MTQHRDIEDWLLAYMDGSLSDAQRRALEEKLSDAPELRRQLEEWTQMAQAISSLPMARPSDQSEARFHAFLEKEKQHAAPSANKFPTRILPLFGGKNIEWGVAAAAVLLLIGVGFGWLWQRYQQQQTEMAALRQEVKQTQRILLLAMLEKPSASERIQAVNVLKTEKADHRVTDALLQTLNFDEMVNVRVKAVQALAHFGQEDPNIKTALLNSLKYQKSPEVQIALIDVLVVLEEKRAVPSFQKMSEDKRLIDIVRQKAATGANMLLYEL